VGKLPVLFRTIRGQRVTPEKLDALIDFIRKRQTKDDILTLG
jgi:hypothetical protein